MDEKGETVRKEKERRNAGDERFKVKHTNGVESSEGPLCLEPSPQESRARALLIIQLFAWILNSIKPSVSLLLLAQPPLPSFPPHRQKAVLLIFIENVSRRQGFRRERERERGGEEEIIDFHLISNNLPTFSLPEENVLNLMDDILFIIQIPQLETFENNLKSPPSPPEFNQKLARIINYSCAKGLFI